MNKTKIEWAEYTWNPIKGLCPVGCWYCYARNIYTRFKLDPKPTCSINELGAFGDRWHRGDGHEKRDGCGPRKTSRIFVCSTFELFHPEAARFRDDIFRVITGAPEHVFVILTKRPEYVDRPMPPNVWLGVSVTRHDDFWRIDELTRAKADLRFVSLEPFLGDADDAQDFTNCIQRDGKRRIDWIIIGRLTGHGHNYDPDLPSLKRIVCQAKKLGIPVFLKNNLRDIWPSELIQEYPRDRED